MNEVIELKTYTARFLGDPTGYVLLNQTSPPLSYGTPMWVLAKVGITERTVWIDAAKAYVIEYAE